MQATTLQASDSKYPRHWSFQDDGLVVSGRHVRFDEADINGRRVGIHVLEVDGQLRSVWAGYWDSAARKVAAELVRRPNGALDEGEVVRYEREHQKRRSETTGNHYWPFRVEFQHSELYRRSPREIFAAEDQPRGVDQERAGHEGDDDSIPF